MANEHLAQGLELPRSGFDRRVAEAGFVILLLLIFIGTTPLDDRSVAALSARNAASASGDFIRQISFLGTFAIILFAALRRRGLSAIRAVPVSLALLMGWCILTSVWSDEPDIVARRAILATIFVLSVMLSVDTLGTARAVALWRYVVAAVIIGDLASVALFHQAVHLPSDVEANLAGSWRGLHSHKNTAGAFAATSAIMFFYFAVENRRRSDIILCIASIFFLVMTRSKSSMGLLPVALIAGALYRVAWRSKLDRAIATAAAGLLLIGLTVTLAVQWQLVARLLEDPQNFTGRAAIWQAEFAYIRDHPLLGAGFGTFGNTGMRSPIYHYVGSGWVSQIGEGHSGYLEMLVTIGGIGFVLGMSAVVVLPFLQFWRPERTDANLNAMLFAVFLFDVLHNFMESDFIQVTAVQWGQLLLVLGLLRVSMRETKPATAVPSWT
ncbi:MAG: O-antigen ligase family protein [Rhizomicrobium sp.]